MTELRFNGITDADANKLVKHFLLQITEVASRSPS